MIIVIDKSIKMNLKELKEDITNKMNYEFHNITYWGLPLEDNGPIYNRRSFNDLIEHYSKFDISEQTLMKAIKELNLVAYYCGTPKRVVFFKSSSWERIKFWRFDERDYAFGKENSFNNFGKYTPTYLEKLYDSV